LFLERGGEPIFGIRVKTQKPILLIGGGGHCAACIEAIESTQEFRIVGILDQAARIGSRLYGYPVVGTDEDMSRFIRRYRNALITVGQIASAATRRRLFKMLCSVKAELPVVAAASAVISRHADMGRGTVVLHGVVVNAGAEVGENCILNTGAIVEHDACIGAHTHISTAACVNGGCIVGKGSFIGSHSTLIQGVRIAERTVIGAASVVSRDIRVAGVYAGNPLRRIR